MGYERFVRQYTAQLVRVTRAVELIRLDTAMQVLCFNKWKSRGGGELVAFEIYDTGIEETVGLVCVIESHSPIQFLGHNNIPLLGEATDRIATTIMLVVWHVVQREPTDSFLW